MTMTLLKFEAELEKALSLASKEQLAAYILKLGRNCAAEKRDLFLQMLNCCTDLEDNAESSTAERSLNAQFNRVADQLKSIEQQIFSLRIEPDEEAEWEDWEDEDIEKNKVVDENGIQAIISAAADLLKECLLQKEDALAGRVAEELLGLQIPLEGYWQESCSVFELNSRFNLKVFNDRELAENIVDAMYRAAPSKARPKTLLHGILECNRQGQPLNLDAFFQRSNESLQERRDFLGHFIDYLKTYTCKAKEQSDIYREKRVHSELMREALCLLEDETQVQALIMEELEHFPSLCKAYLTLSEKTCSPAKAQFCLEVVAKMPKNYLYRGIIATELARYAMPLPNNQEILEQALLAAFESQTSPSTFWRYFLTSKNPQKKAVLWAASKSYMQKKTQKEVLSDTFSEAYYTNFWAQEDEENRKTEKMETMLYFLNGMFLEFFERTLKQGIYIGWSSTSIKESLSLLLLCFYNGTETTKAIEDLLECVLSMLYFNVQEFTKGFENVPQEKSHEFLFTLLQTWKKSYPLTDETQQVILEYIQKDLLPGRIDAIMENNRRRFYNECASFLAAVGEVHESHGERGFKQRYLQQYHDKYPRPTAFTDSLRLYGLKDK